MIGPIGGFKGEEAGVGRAAPDHATGKTKDPMPSPGPETPCFEAALNAVVAEERALAAGGRRAGCRGPSKPLVRSSTPGPTGLWQQTRGSNSYYLPRLVLSAAPKGGGCGGKEVAHSARSATERLRK